MLEVPFFSHRNLGHLIMSGVFERFPALKYVMTEQGVAWAVEDLRRMDGYHAQMKHGRVGELGFSADIVLPMKPSEYFDRNVWIGASFPSPGEAAAMKELGAHKTMWGSDYPHHEGTFPYSKESLQRAFHDWDEADMRRVLSGNAAEVYRFDLEKLAPLAAEHGHPSRMSPHRSPRYPPTRIRNIRQEYVEATLPNDVARLGVDTNNFFTLELRAGLVANHHVQHAVHDNRRGPTRQVFIGPQQILAVG